ncbi:HSPB1-associated protein 1 isoform X2 [Adelges cooleyi]|nr:HSPB1-associated protein 1 isoform X2 [Adelges cooleyi]
MRSLWTKACGINEKDFLPSTVICSIHFEKDCFKSVSKKILKQDAIPTKFIRGLKSSTSQFQKFSYLKTLVNPQEQHKNNEDCQRDKNVNTSLESGLCIDENQPGTSNVSTKSSVLSPSESSDKQIIRHFIESSTVPIVFHKMLDDWELFTWDLQKWNQVFVNQPLDCRKGRITCTKEPLWESKCFQESHSFNDIIDISENVETDGNWLYFDYKYIGEKVDSKMFKSISWKKFGYENLNEKDSTLWIGSTGAHTPCHQDLYGINLVAQIYGKKRWILMPPEMGKYLKPTRVPYEESSCYSKINFSCPDNLKSISEYCKCISIVLSPGDVLYVPHKWWHYVENVSPAISINSWIPVPKYDNLSRLNESIIRFLVSSVCSGVSKSVQSRLLNPNEKFTPDTITESLRFIDQSLNKVNNDAASSTEFNFKIPTPLDYQCTLLKADQLLNSIDVNTKYHSCNHSPKYLESDIPNNIHEQILNSLCDENVMSRVISNLLNNN